MYIETPQSRSQAVVCVSTPKMYPRSGYFLVYNKVLLRANNFLLPTTSGKAMIKITNAPAIDLILIFPTKVL